MDFVNENGHTTATRYFSSIYYLPAAGMQQPHHFKEYCEGLPLKNKGDTTQGGSQG
jgi:hypothetical protein